MVSDLAAVYGKTASLTKEHMVSCLVPPHGGCRRCAMSPCVLRSDPFAARWRGGCPSRAAVGVGAYAYFDTSQVGATAMELFDSHPLVTMSDGDRSFGLRNHDRRGAAKTQ